MLYETAQRQEDFHRLRVSAGETDAFGIRAVAARDRMIGDLGARVGIGFTYPVDPAECRYLADLILLYRVVLGREPDQDGLRHHVERLRGGIGLRSIADQFLASAEFTAMPGADDAAGLLCRQGAGREPGQFERGMLPADLAVALVASPEVAGRHSVLATAFPDGLPIQAPHLYAWWDEERERLDRGQVAASGAPFADPALSVIVLIDRPLGGQEAEVLSRQVRDLAGWGQIVLAPVDAFSTWFCRRFCADLRGHALAMVSTWRAVRRMRWSPGPSGYAVAPSPVCSNAATSWPPGGSRRSCRGLPRAIS